MTVKLLVETFFAWVKEVDSPIAFPKENTGRDQLLYQEEALKVFLIDTVVDPLITT